MKLNTVHLYNYRAHEDLAVSFSDHFNVVAGVNGSGKTSLLKGICESLNAVFLGTNVAANWFSEPGYAYVKTLESNGRFRFEPQLPVRVEANADAFNRSYAWTIRKNDDITGPQVEGQYPVIKAQAAAPSAIPNTLVTDAVDGSYKGLETFPLLAFYRANRQWRSTDVGVQQAATQKLARASAYDQWWDAAANVFGLQSWVIAKCLERFQHSSETGLRFDEIDDDELALVNKALSQALENARGLRYDMPQRSLLMDMNHPDGSSADPIAFEHLSDGQRAVICLVADIARRMCLLNPHLGKEVVRETPGIVLIDELDVHLHPKWQRAITNGLKTAFPALQFVVTSHSPQILGELHPNEIILLRDGSTTQPQVSYGLDSSQVLEEIMEASARTQKVEEQLKKLFALVERNELEAAKSLLATLRTTSPQIPELGGAEALIRRKEVVGR